MRRLSLGGRFVGDGEPCFVIAESGANHNRDLGMARELIAVAAERCQVALVAYASRQRTKRGRSMVRALDPTSLSSQFEVPYGLPTPIGHYADPRALAGEERRVTRELVELLRSLEAFVCSRESAAPAGFLTQQAYHVLISTAEIATRVR